MIELKSQSEKAVSAKDREEMIELIRSAAPDAGICCYRSTPLEDGKGLSMDGQCIMSAVMAETIAEQLLSMLVHTRPGHGWEVVYAIAQGILSTQRKEPALSAMRPEGSA